MSLTFQSDFLQNLKKNPIQSTILKFTEKEQKRPWP